MLTTSHTLTKTHYNAEDIVACTYNVSAYGAWVKEHNFKASSTTQQTIRFQNFKIKKYEII